MNAPSETSIPGVVALGGALFAIATTLVALLYEATVFGVIGGAALSDVRIVIAAGALGAIAALVAMVAGALAVRSRASRTLGIVALVLVALAVISWTVLGALYVLAFVLLDPSF